MYRYFYGALDQINGFLNSNRGTRAPYNQNATPKPALDEIAFGRTAPLGRLPGTLLHIAVTPQAGDALHAVRDMFMLPVASTAAHSGGWAGHNYTRDPPPKIPPIILPPATWEAMVGTYHLAGLSAVVKPGQPFPAGGHPKQFQVPSPPEGIMN